MKYAVRLYTHPTLAYFYSKLEVLPAQRHRSGVHRYGFTSDILNAQLCDTVLGALGHRQRAGLNDSIAVIVKVDGTVMEVMPEPTPKPTNLREWVMSKLSWKTVSY